MPQPINLMGSGSGTLLVRHQTRTLLHACPGSVVLEVEQVLHIPSQRSHPGVKVRALEVKHGLKVLLPYGVLLIRIRRSAIYSAAVEARRFSHREVRAMCAIISTPVLGSLPMTDPDHSSVGS
jgi:hypothetical protein